MSFVFGFLREEGTAATASPPFPKKKKNETFSAHFIISFHPHTNTNTTAAATAAVAAAATAGEFVSKGSRERERATTIRSRRFAHFSFCSHTSSSSSSSTPNQKQQPPAAATEAVAATRAAAATEAAAAAPTEASPLGTKGKTFNESYLFTLYPFPFWPSYTFAPAFAAASPALPIDVAFCSIF